MTQHCYQVNLQIGWGGGEVYTTFFSRALLQNGVKTTLFVHRDNPLWAKNLPDGVEVKRIASVDEIARCLPANQRSWLLFHTPAKAAALQEMKLAGHLLSCIAHMPLYGRDPATLAAYDWIIGVSGHVLDSLEAAGLHQYHPEPLWGIADLSNRQAQEQPIKANSPYDWDQRKGRDRLLSYLYPIYECLLPKKYFSRRPGTTLGIVSRLTPIKQFPLLFQYLTPILRRHPTVNLEIFGAGGYASVRDLQRELAPLGKQVRFWGQQQNVASVYSQLDYLLTGLPEKEALGLNVIEAQACGTPVLAVDSRPFTETVFSEISGLFFTDPRKDTGKSFEELLTRILCKPFKIKTEEALENLTNFSAEAFKKRVERLIFAAFDQMNNKTEQT